MQPPGGGSSNIFTCENLSQPLDSTNRPLKEASVCESLQPLSNNEPTNLSSEIKEVAMKSAANSQQPTVQPVICRSRNSGIKLKGITVRYKVLHIRGCSLMTLTIYGRGFEKV